jgi:hypothetical protein
MSTAIEAPKRSFFVIKYRTSHYHLEGCLVRLVKDGIED